MVSVSVGRRTVGDPRARTCDDRPIRLSRRFADCLLPDSPNGERESISRNLRPDAQGQENLGHIVAHHSHRLLRIGRHTAASLAFFDDGLLRYRP
jgi:hypothetical protein